MKKAVITAIVVLVLVALFLYHRYSAFGKGNRSLLYPTLFGWPRYDEKAAALEGLQVVNDRLVPIA